MATYEQLFGGSSGGGKKKKKPTSPSFPSAVLGGQQYAHTQPSKPQYSTNAPVYSPTHPYSPGRSRSVSAPRSTSRPSRGEVLARVLGNSSLYGGLDQHQSTVLNRVLSTGLRMGADPEEMLAATETGLVESGLRNLDYGDADSLGWRQERTSIYGTGKKGPNNVRASARRFFQEADTDPGTQNPATPGLLAQAIQGSAFPERYDERENEAQALLRQFYDRVKKAGGGRFIEGAPSGTQVPSLIKIGKKAQRKFGVEAREHPYFDPVDPVHTQGSMHYSNDAIDFQGDAQQLSRLNRWLARRFGSETDELFYDPGINIADGARTDAIGGHGTHVHFGLDDGSKGERAYPVSGAIGSALSGGGIAGGAGSLAAMGGTTAARELALGGTRRSGGGISPILSPLAARAPRPLAPRPNQRGGEEGELDPVDALIDALYQPRKRLAGR